MADQEQSLKEWLAEEKARLDKGFTFEPKPSSQTSEPGAAGAILAGAGLGAGVVGGAMGPHANPVTFEGVKASVIINALRSEIPDDDTRVQVNRTDATTVVAILQSQARRPRDFFPALTVNLVETPDALTVTVSDLDQDAKRGALGSIGRTALNQGKRLLFRRRGIRGLFQTAGDLVDGVQDMVEDIQDLGLPKQVWEVIDRVGEAAEGAYLEQRSKEQRLQREREAAEQVWLYCQYCGHAYKVNEGSLTNCSACGGPRGPKPDWLE
ncbi:MAG: hypothetical protein DRJ03_14275 [Chloroflexi bacterium]|nr:MAG: hypothetical protein B6I35_08430 [Anaerolineaceae bacterium 4572_32.2]RLC80978.1 MAG: hypothetical protein DRI81_03475 [Chloroflexota bacterium]RLC84410.1 MAG: hypothetical protein DRJ03_14275 [Chloroflexota bacterium]HEY73350.1 hypothetical protein [Thermoflexia bacterium]